MQSIRAPSSNKILFLIVLWSFIFAAWVFADPPAGAPGTTSGIISAYDNKVGIGTNTPATLLDVNGATTIRKVLDVTNNAIINVAVPVAGTDAANKNYVDSQTGGSNSSKLWGEGRVGTAVINTAGECTNTIGGRTIKISRSNRNAHWDGAAAVCPVGWWVCTAADRDKNGSASGYGGCGSGTVSIADCSLASNTTEELNPTTANRAWINDIHANSATSGRGGGGAITVTGSAADDEVCSILPALCCAYQ